MKVSVRRWVTPAVIVVAVACSSWAGMKLLDATYDLRKYGSPYGFADLQRAGDPAAAVVVLQSWVSSAASPALFGRAHDYATWDLAFVAGNGIVVAGLLLWLRGPLRRARDVPRGWWISDRVAVGLNALALPAACAAIVGAVLGLIADLMYRALLTPAQASGAAAAAGTTTVIASALVRTGFALTAVAVAVLVVCGLLLLARNRSARLAEFIEVVRVTRFSLLAVVVVGVGLCWPDQLRDAFRALAEGSWLRVILTEVVLLAWGFSVWYTGRFLLNVSFETPGPPDPPEPLWGERHWPRILGVTGFLVFALATWLAWYEVADAPDVDYPRLRVLAVLNVGLAIAFGVFTRIRRRVATKLTGRKTFDNPRGKAYRDMPPSVKWLVGGALIVVVALWLMVFFVPQPLAPYLGTVALLLGASITVTMAGSLIVWLGERAKLPAVSIVFGLAILFSLFNDNHAVRRLPDAPAPARIEIRGHLQEWYRWIDAKYPGQTEHPLFVVSAAGGGIRAAYWTAAVLARLQDLDPAFADHVLLVSSVSGGSLGSLVFANLLDSTEPGGDWRGRHASFGARDDPECDYPAHAPGKYQALAARILARDFLAPTTASMLYGDFLARLLPYSLLSDRAEALEVSWERAWDATKRSPPAELTSTLWDGNPFTRSFDALHPAERITPSPARHVPLVVVNGTIVESGTRILVSHLDHPKAFKGDVENAFDHRGAPMRMSTVALMSARFTYVSPAGTYAPGTHVVDGGYFENSGAATALQWWAQLEDDVIDFNTEAKKKAPRPALIRDVFIYIDNSAPDVARAGATGTGPEPRRMEFRERTPRLLPEISAPIDALLAARGAHAVEAKARARQSFDPDFIAFDTNVLRRPPAATTQQTRKAAERLNKAPLGWVLSRSAQQILDRELCRNDDSIADVLALLPKKSR
jgi:hypothetical protein